MAGRDKKKKKAGKKSKEQTDPVGSMQESESKNRQFNSTRKYIVQEETNTRDRA